MHTHYLAQCPIIQTGADTLSSTPSEAVKQWLSDALMNAIASTDKLALNDSFDDQISWIKQNRDSIVSLNHQAVDDDGRMLWFSVRTRLLTNAIDVIDRTFQYEVELRVQGFPEQTSDLTNQSGVETHENMDAEHEDESYSFGM